MVSVPDAYDPDGGKTYSPDRYGQQPFVGDDLTQPNEPYWAHVDRVFKEAERLGLPAAGDAGLPRRRQGRLRRPAEEGRAPAVPRVRAVDRQALPRARGTSSGCTAATGTPGTCATRCGRWPRRSARWTSSTCTRPTGRTARRPSTTSATRAGSTSTARTPTGRWRGASSPIATDVPPRPTFLIESHYENDFGGKTADDVRAYPYRAVLSGAAGHLFGNKPLWFCGRGWEHGARLARRPVHGLRPRALPLASVVRARARPQAPARSSRATGSPARTTACRRR